MKWAAPMGRLLGIDERPADRAGQTARHQNGRCGRYMAPYDGKVPVSGDGVGGEVCLRDSTNVWKILGGDKGWHS